MLLLQSFVTEKPLNIWSIQQSY